MNGMLVTLDVSKLSGWLKAEAYCRVAQGHVEGDTGGWEVRGGAAVVWRCTQRARTEEPTGHWARHARGAAHRKHAIHGCDAGRVEAQWLVER